VRIIRLPAKFKPYVSKEEKEILREFLRLTRRSFYFAGVLSFFINLLMLLPSIYMLAVYDIVVPSRSVESLIVITILIVALYLFWAVLQMLRSKILLRIHNKLDNFYNQNVINATFEFGLKYPTKASIQPITDFNQIKQFLTSPTLTAFFDLPWVPIYFITLCIFHIYYGIWTILVLIVIISITILNELTTRKSLKEANESQISSNKFLTHLIQNVEIIEAMGMRERVYKKWFENYHKKYMVLFQRANDRGAFWSNFSRVTRVMSQSLIYGVGGFLAINLKITGGMIVAGAILLGRVLSPIDILISTWRNFVSARLSYRRLSQLLQEMEAVKAPSVKLPPPRGEILVRNLVVIPPEGSEPVIKNISLKINPGELVVIIGPSGAGKTSFIKALLGIWPATSGEVCIDGASLSQWPREYLGQFIGYLPQDIELFEGTVAENISRFEEVDSEKVIQAAMLAGVHEIIVKFPKGYDTYIGPGGITLSAGQRQRIGLARALYGDPRIVVLDEPNSNLDDAGEAALHQALLKLKEKEITTIVISHKVSILNIADKIAIIRDGVLVIYDNARKVIEALKKTQAHPVRRFMTN